jgi:hypothetical protein
VVFVLEGQRYENKTPSGNKPKVSMKFNLVQVFVSFTRYLPKKYHMVTTKWIPHFDQEENLFGGHWVDVLS